MRPRQGCGSYTNPTLGPLCYIVPGTSFGERNGQHEQTAWEWRNPRFSGCCAVCFAVHFGIQTGSIWIDSMDGIDWTSV